MGNLHMHKIGITDGKDNLEVLDLAGRLILN
jgi:hypothetical protein